MTLKQRIMLVGAIVTVAMIDGLHMTLIHVSPMIPIVIMCVWTFVSGISIGNTLHKWKRDKEMAGLVAERLMRKIDVPMSSGMYTNSAAAQGINYHLISQNNQMANSTGTGINSLLGSINGSGLGKQ